MEIWFKKKYTFFTCNDFKILNYINLQIHFEVYIRHAPLRDFPQLSLMKISFAAYLMIFPVVAMKTADKDINLKTNSRVGTCVKNMIYKA